MHTFCLDTSALLNAIHSMKGARVLIIGDVMLDHYINGGVDRISPEAPVPVVNVRGERFLCGGAGNVARNILSLGGSPRLISIAGRDDARARLADLFDQESITHDLLEIPGRDTTIKTRIIAHNQQVVRIDRECVDELDDANLQKLFDMVEAALPGHDAIIVSDYGKGLVSKFFLRGLREMCHAMPRTPKILVDPKTRNFHLYNDVFLLTPNTNEAREGAGIQGAATYQDVFRTGQAIFRKLDCEHLLITMGADGMALFQAPNEAYHIPTLAQRVFDVTGAGDTVIATLGLGLAARQPLNASAVLANYAAGIVVGEIGTAAVTSEALRHAIQHVDPPCISPLTGSQEAS